MVSLHWINGSMQIDIAHDGGWASDAETEEYYSMLISA